MIFELRRDQRGQLANCFRTHKLLKVGSIYKYHLGIFAFKNIHNLVHDDARLNLRARYVGQNYTRNRDVFYNDFDTTEVRRRSAKFMMIDLWNALPDDIRSTALFALFKVKLRDHFCGFQ